MSHDEELKHMTPVFCDSFYDNSFWAKIVPLAIVIFVPALNLYSAWTVYTRRRFIIIRQRAPLVAVLLLILIFFNYLWELWFEFLIRYRYLSHWETATSMDQIPFTRKLAKFAVIFMRLSISYVTAFRTLIIWCDWHKTSYRTGLTEKLIHFFCNERKALTGMIVGLLMWSAVFYGDSGNLTNIETGLDWYSPGHEIAYALWSPTTVRVIEMFVCITSLYLIRNFPSGFNIKQEIFTIMATWFCSDQYFEFKLYKSDVGKGYCSIMGFRQTILLISLRTVIVASAFLYFCKDQDLQHPAPSNPSNFVEFIQISQYRKAFLNFLGHLGKSELQKRFYMVQPALLINSSYEDYPDASLRMNDLSIVKELSAKFERTSSKTVLTRSEEERITMIEELPKLVEDFEADYYEFKRTKSYTTIRRHLEEEARAFYMGIDGLSR